MGQSHLASGAPCQDAFGIQEVPGAGAAWLAAAVSDGAGSALHAREGARTVVRALLQAAAGACDLPDEAVATQWLASARDSIAALASAREATMRDFAATLVFALVAEDATVLVHVGDGAAVIDGPNGWEVASWPANGEYAGTTYFVTDDPGPRIALTRMDRPVNALALFSDGLERLLINTSAGTLNTTMLDGLFDVLRAGAGQGCDRKLSRSLRRFLRREDLDAWTHDDKSLVLALRR